MLSFLPRSDVAKGRDYEGLVPNSRRRLSGGCSLAAPRPGGVDSGYHLAQLYEWPGVQEPVCREDACPGSALDFEVRETKLIGCVIEGDQPFGRYGYFDVHKQPLFVAMRRVGLLYFARILLCCAHVPPS